MDVNGPIIGVIENVVIGFFGFTAIIGALILVLQKNPVRAALGLLLSMVSIGMLFLAEGASFVGFVQLMIYAGAIVILFLFAVMHFPLGRQKRPRLPHMDAIGFLGVVVLGITMLINLALIFQSKLLASGFAPRLHPNIEVKNIGLRFMDDWIYPFELISVLLLVGVIAAVYITRGPGHLKNPGGDE
ncbi:MAG TPA: NADH-quinone oxidoreductase subunit J [bacterium]|jgi:NADH-quinone oxidoreductase subunit J